MMRASLLSSALILAGAVSAQAQDWNYNATLYGWVPGLDASVETPFGTVVSDKSPTDVLNALDMAFMGHFVAQNDRWAFIADLMYADLSASQNTPFNKAFSLATVETKLTAFSGYALYRISTDPKIKFDAGVGFRTFNLDMSLNLSPGNRPGWERSTSTSWTDPLLAARLVVPINDQWFVNGFADFGGTGGDDQTWQVYAGVGYKINDKWSTEAGWRYMEVSKDLGDTNSSATMDLSGPLFGVTYSF